MPPAPGGPDDPFQLVDFIVCNFPYQETPDQPGPEPHICLCLGTMRSHGGELAVVAAYTTTQPWPVDTAKPRGVRSISLEQAKRMGQHKAFVIDLRRIGFMPPTEAFFPRLTHADRGRIGSNPALANKFLEELNDLLSSPGVVVQLGPLRPSR